MEGFNLTWMAWTWPTAGFFAFIFGCILAMGLWEYFSPGGAPRRGILRLETTRGDRLFISLLGSAFILLAWLAVMGPPIWAGVAICVAYALAVYRFV